ncbi:hypothetical protein [Halorarius halobius]|uniref:hypothetical protein n=1 Tax=Halorarius halobius TaxID=2962671 RepID=UPI0020CCE5E7|nr:hypothetical protein [Halorarius halobius]
MSDESGPSRRTLLKAGGAVAGVGAVGLLGAEVYEEATAPPPDTAAGEYDPAALAEQFAPDLQFGAYEKWFPTDPRPYAEQRDGERVVDGFAALNGYSGAYLETGEPPAPTVFYNVVEVTPALVAVQYWFYYAFDQFTVNFHWHDWEVLQVFVDTDDRTPVLLSASSHSRKVPNNEFLDPGDGDTVAVLSETGSHSSATNVNEEERTFQRLSVDGVDADVTNDLVEAASTVGEFPLAYGLPRDEGGRLPFVMPELDGMPLYDHPDVEVGREAFVAPEATVRSLTDLARPPGDIPEREPGATWVFEGSDRTGDVAYALEPTTEVEDIDAFAGPQLSFEFAVPGFVEDRVASHITTTETPWTQPRYENPLADVTDASHREALADRYGLDISGGFADAVVGRVEELVGGTDGRLRGADGSDDTVAGAASVSLSATETEALCLLESPDPTAVPTARGVFGLVDVAEQDHRLTVNGPGYAPRSERFPVGGDDPVQAGVEGNVTLVRNDAAVKVRADPGDTEVARTRLTDDFAGRIYDATPPTDGEFAVYVHREGSYSLELEDEAGDTGAYRVDPDESDEQVTVEVETGQASLASYLVDYLAESARLAREFESEESDDEDEDGDRGGRSRESVAAKFDSAKGAAERAAEFASEGDRKQANEQLSTVVERLNTVVEFLQDDATFSAAVVDLLTERAEHAREKARAAMR